MPKADKPDESHNNETRSRLSPEDRRRQLVRVTSEIIAADGVDNVRIPYVAATAGVTRPVVYKFFPNRQALIRGVLEDFKTEFEARLPELTATSDADVNNLARQFVDAACDVINDTGAGGWILLGSGGPDAQTAELVSEMQEQLLEPWVAGIEALTGSAPHQSRALGHMLLAGGQSVIGRWMRDELSRDEVTSLLLRTILAVLQEFARSN